jgi:hypothetical protein
VLSLVFWSADWFDIYDSSRASVSYLVQFATSHRVRVHLWERVKVTESQFTHYVEVKIKRDHCLEVIGSERKEDWTHFGVIRSNI